MKPPRVGLIGHAQGHNVYLVDGPEIRKNTDQDFTNFAQPLDPTKRYIPANEVWIDSLSDPAERRYFINNALREYQTMKAGHGRNAALDAGDRLEAAERRGDPEKGKPVAKKLVKQIGPLRVYVVDGDEVRDAHDISFTEGGHDLVYHWIPKNEIWLEQANGPDSLFVLLHELFERNRMAEGLRYPEAHKEASHVEVEARRDPAELQDLMAAETYTAAHSRK